jgi:hypothetical protein
MRRLVDTKIDKKKRGKGKGGKKKGREEKGKKRSTKKCPAKKTPQCSRLHKWHNQHLKYHNVMDNDLLKTINSLACRWEVIFLNVYWNNQRQDSRNSANQ